MLRLKRQRFQDQKVQRALRQIDSFVGHAPLRLLQDGYSKRVVEA